MHKKENKMILMQGSFQQAIILKTFMNEPRQGTGLPILQYVGVSPRLEITIFHENHLFLFEGKPKKKREAQHKTYPLLEEPAQETCFFKFQHEFYST